MPHDLCIPRCVADKVGLDSHVSDAIYTRDEVSNQCHTMNLEVK